MLRVARNPLLFSYETVTLFQLHSIDHKQWAIVEKSHANTLDTRVREAFSNDSVAVV